MHTECNIIKTWRASLSVDATVQNGAGLMGGAGIYSQACQSLEVISAENKKLIEKSMYSPLFDGNDVITC